MEVDPPTIRIIVKGGAYRRMPPGKKEHYVEATKKSARVGYRVLKVRFNFIYYRKAFDT